ncbi:MAG: HIT domain-containing protein [Candidatus Babeliaceae bacterium]|nr:HIT domain-containing protein [Candidatus Babeliaceae bacterium]
MEKTIFSRIIDREIPAKIIAENNDVVVIEDIAPKAPIHYLIIPKNPIRDIQSMTESDFKLANALFRMAQQLSREISGAEHFRVLINSGTGVGQSVPHLHLHFLAGKTFSDF